MDYGKLLNQNLLNVEPSGIRKFFSIAQEMDDVISLGVGEPDFLTPYHVRETAIKTLEDGDTKYTANAGLASLRKEIANFYEKKYFVKYDSETEALVTVGGSEGIDLCIRSFVSVGDEVIVPEPVSYTHLDVYKRQTISRVNRSLQYGCDGYDKIFERIRESEDEQL